MAGRWAGTGGLLLLVAVAAQGQMSLQEALQRRTEAPTPRIASATSSMPPPTLSEALARMASDAEVIFIGEVIGVRQNTRAVEVKFHVETALRGAHANSTYTVREWPGLWVAGDRRYRVGQRAIVLLHGPSLAGYSSPVAGGDGVLPLQGNALTGQVDVRWLATQVQRGGTTPLPAVVHLVAVRPVAGTPLTILPEPKPDALPVKLDCALVFDMLRSLTAEQRR